MQAEAHVRITQRDLSRHGLIVQYHNPKLPSWNMPSSSRSSHCQIPRFTCVTSSVVISYEHSSRRPHGSMVSFWKLMWTSNLAPEKHDSFDITDMMYQRMYFGNAQWLESFASFSHQDRRWWCELWRFQPRMQSEWHPKYAGHHCT